MNIEFCKKCTISNFRPSSCIEFKKMMIKKKNILNLQIIYVLRVM